MNDEGTVGVTLLLDGIYYQQAKQMMPSAEAADEDYAHWEKILSETNEKAAALDGEPSREDELHDLCVVLDRHWQSVDIVATELIKRVATMHMLCAASLEAHINIRAERTLSRKSWEEFDKLAVTGKWMFYPHLASIGSFDPGQRPFQDLQTLIKRRNALMHYRVKRANVSHGYVLPPLIDQLGLRASAAKESLRAVKEMVGALAAMQKDGTPEWGAGDFCSALMIEY